MAICVPKTASAGEILQAALRKFQAHDRNFDVTCSWTICYPDVSAVDNLPETNDTFQLDTYRQQILKDYQRIVLYIAPGLDICCHLSHDYFARHVTLSLT